MIKHNFRYIFLILCFGYLVDYYDLSIFAVARSAILQDLNVPIYETMATSKLIFNAQALGIFIGGILTGIWGDKIGRVFAIRLGILVYSTAIILNIFATTIPQFVFFRFLSSIGLSGELAASVTLLSEISIGENRGKIGGAIYFFGILGGIISTGVQSLFNWKVLFLIGGISGYVLLFLRKFLVDPSLFNTLKLASHIPRGSLKLMLLKWSSIVKIFKLTLCLVPFWFMVFFVNFAPEIAKRIGIFDKINLPYCLFIFFIGSLIGAPLFTIIDKNFNSHKKSIFFSFFLMIISLSLLVYLGPKSVDIFSNLYLLFGISSGYFGIYMVYVTENFGTNQRATGSSLVNNLGRASFILINSFVPFIIDITENTAFGVILSALIVIGISFLCLYFTQETFGKELDFIEK